MRVSTDSYCVAKITAQSSEPLLAEAAEANVRTWWFDSHQPGTFNLTFNYRLLRNTISFLEKPDVVELWADVPIVNGGSPQAWSELYNSGDYDAEVWKAELTSPQVHEQVTFRFAYGCCEEGQVTDANGKKEKIAQGSRSDSDVGFSTVIGMINGRHKRVSFIGRLRNNDSMQGVFLDESGTRGTWSAKLISHGSLKSIL